MKKNEALKRLEEINANSEKNPKEALLELLGLMSDVLSIGEEEQERPKDAFFSIKATPKDADKGVHFSIELEVNGVSESEVIDVLEDTIERIKSNGL